MISLTVHCARHNPIISDVLYGVLYLALQICMSGVSNAGQVESFNIIAADGVYEANIVAILDAPANYVYGVITDFRHIYRINPSIVESEILSVENNAIIRVRNRLEHCFAIFCFQIDLVEDVAEIGNRHIVATTVSELSSFESGNTMWHVRPFSEDSARVQYRAKMKPNFFIPPLIGSHLVKSFLRKEITNSLFRIECNARIAARNDDWEAPIQIAERTRSEKDCAG